MKKKENLTKMEGNSPRKILTIQIPSPKIQMILARLIASTIPIQILQGMQMVLFQITPTVKLTK